MAERVGLVIPFDKPLQWTSFQVVNKLKWHIKRTFGLKKFKIGHAGTLDPLASGLLLVCVGSATKQIDTLQSGIKEYSGTMVLGATTPCYDLEQAIDRYYPTDNVNAENIEAARQHFTGEIEQVPPMFSAVKVDGKRAYVSARDGSPVEIAPKKVTVYDFKITGFRPGKEGVATLLPKTAEDAGRELYRNPRGTVPEHLPQIDFFFRCSKGTYIRSIARDFGEELHCGAFLSALRRERIGDYSVNEALNINDMESVITVDNPTYSILSALKTT